MVDDDPANRDLLTQIFERENYEIQTAESGERALEILRGWNASLVVLDQDMPGLTGLETLKQIKAHFEGTDVVFVSAHSNPKMVSQALEQGADDYIRKPFSITELSSRVHVRFRIRDLREELRGANAKLADLSVKDDLTGLYNMRSIYEKIEYEIKRTKRTGRAMACVMMDMDHFKTVNDGHDHLFGSFVLREMGQILQRSLRETDFAARYGGDEYLVVLTETDEHGAKTFCDRVLQTVRGYTFRDKSESIQLTVSIGYSVCGPDFAFEPKDIVRCADHALYQSKENGRNQVNGFGLAETTAHLASLKKKSAA